jgi:hypothetical protein
LEQEGRGVMNIVKKVKKWLVTHYLPALACGVFEREVAALRRQLNVCEAELEQARHSNARLESYICGLECALRSRQVIIHVKGGAAGHGKE